jgi:thioredoxin 1
MAAELSRDDVDRLQGVTILEFGASWCGYCLAARPLIDQARADHPGVRHIRSEDGRGKRLGRSFQVKLWPTLIVLHDGREVARVVRPRHASQIREALGRLDAQPIA